MKNLILRSVTGLLFITIIIAGIFVSQHTFFALFALVTGVTLHEFYKITSNGKLSTSALIPNILGGVYLYAILFLQQSQQSPIATTQLFAPYLFYFIYTMVYQLYAKQANPIEEWAKAFLGHLYIAVPMGLLSHIAYQNSALGVVYCPFLMLAFYVFIWVNDSGAYLVGVTCGKHRLFERISPKKSWEGFFGGLFFAMAAGYVASLFSPTITTMQWIGLALVVSTTSTLGDLCESLLKRTLNVKDSGTLLPGHGGMLDRFDSVLLAAPAAVIYLAYC